MKAFGLLASLFALLSLPNAYACVPLTPDTVRKFSDVIVEGTFLLESADRGEGRIVPTRIIKGIRKKAYPVKWEPNPEDVFQPHEIDCLVTPTKHGSFNGFNLHKMPEGRYEIIGRWSRATKDN